MTQLSFQFRSTLPRLETFFVIDDVEVVQLTGVGTGNMELNGSVTCDFTTNDFTVLPASLGINPAGISTCHFIMSLQLGSVTSGMVSYSGVGTLYYDSDSLLLIDEVSSNVAAAIEASRPSFPDVVEVVEVIVVARMDRLVLNLDNTAAPDGDPLGTDDSIVLTGAQFIELEARDSIIFKDSQLTVLRGSRVLATYSDIFDFESILEVRTPFSSTPLLQLSRDSLMRTGSISGPGQLYRGISGLVGGGIAFFTSSGSVFRTIQDGIANGQLNFISRSDNTAAIDGLLPPNVGARFIEINAESQFFSFGNAAYLMQTNGAVVIRDGSNRVIRQFGTTDNGCSLVYFDNQIRSSSATESLDQVDLRAFGGVDVVLSETASSCTVFAYSSGNTAVTENINELRSNIVIPTVPPITFGISTNSFGVSTLTSNGVALQMVSLSMSASAGDSQCSLYSGNKITILNGCDSSSPANCINGINTARVYLERSNGISEFSGSAFSPIPGGGQWFFFGTDAFYTDSGTLISFIRSALGNAPSASVSVISEQINNNTLVSLNIAGTNFFTFGDVFSTRSVDIESGQALIYSSGNLGIANLVIPIPQGADATFNPSTNIFRITEPAGIANVIINGGLFAQVVPGSSEILTVTDEVEFSGGILYIGEVGSLYTFDDRADISLFNNLNGVMGLNVIVGEGGAANLSVFDGGSLQQLTGSSSTALSGTGTLYLANGQFFFTTSTNLINTIPPSVAQTRPIGVTYTATDGTIIIADNGGTSIISLPIGSTVINVPTGVTVQFESNMTMSDDRTLIIPSNVEELIYFDGIQLITVTPMDDTTLPGGGLLLVDETGTMAFYTTESSTELRISQVLSGVTSTFVGPTVIQSFPDTITTFMNEVATGFGQLLTVYQGATVSLICSAGNANPPATFSFFQRSTNSTDSVFEPVQPSLDVSVIMNGPNSATLLLTDVMTGEVEYQCVATNSESSSSRITRVTVLPGGER